MNTSDDHQAAVCEPNFDDRYRALGFTASDVKLLTPLTQIDIAR